MRRPYFIITICATLALGVVFALNYFGVFGTTYSFTSGELNSVSSTALLAAKINPNADIEPQKPLENPPKIINAVYLTSWAAGNKNFVDYAIDLAANTEINAVVIDVKDYSGLVAYDTEVEPVDRYNTEEIRISKPNALIKKLHDMRIYAIARISVFQDPALAEARPDLAVQSISAASSTTDVKKLVWRDRKNLAWTDPASREVWDYNIAIAKDAAARGFDELNFDYIRFPSDGNMNDMRFPFWDELVPQSEIIENFFAYLRSELDGVKISADLFGLTTIEKNDMGIGQLIENAYPYFDFVAPMVYPSHYGHGVLGFENPAENPYEIVRGSLDSAYARLNATSTTATSTLPYIAKLRPWLQDFSLGVTYNVEKVSAQIRAVRDSLGQDFAGFMLWSPSNKYTRAALGAE